MQIEGKRFVVTGGAGFIGSHTVEALVTAGAKVTVVDNLASGDRAHLANVEDQIHFIEGDVGDAELMRESLAGVDGVWHLAANPEVRVGETEPAAHYTPNVHLTFRLLESMRESGVRWIGFTSTSTVYGEAQVFPTPEAYGPLLPVSVYGGCKLACEGLISSYCGTFGMDALLFRFANVVGPRSSHGVTYDFVQKLRRDPQQMEILGDGRQNKSYVHVKDVASGMLHAAKEAPAGCHAYNVGSDDAIPVTDIADIVAETLGARPEYSFTGKTGQGGGWVGDVPQMRLAIDKLRSLGWSPQHDSAQAIRETARWLADAP